MRHAVIYDDISARSGQVAEWFDTELAARVRAEKVLRDGLSRTATVVKTVAVVHSMPTWSQT